MKVIIAHPMDPGLVEQEDFGLEIRNNSDVANLSFQQFFFASSSPESYPHDMPSRGRHQSTSKECKAVMKKIEAMDGVTGVIIGRSYGGKSLGQGSTTGAVKVQRQVSGGIKAVTQSAKGLQEIYIRTESGYEDGIMDAIRNF